jgi:hypothetical protein
MGVDKENEPLTVIVMIAYNEEFDRSGISKLA